MRAALEKQSNSKMKRLLGGGGGGRSCVHVSVMNFCLAEVTRALFSSHAPRF